MIDEKKLTSASLPLIALSRLDEESQSRCSGQHPQRGWSFSHDESAWFIVFLERLLAMRVMLLGASPTQNSLDGRI
jgi:hypothetical protein